jgi:hypothetical protein
MAEDIPEDQWHPERRKRLDAKCPRHQNKDYRRLVQAAWDAMWWCKRGGDNHIHCYPPDGSRMIPVPCTPRKQGTLNLTAAKFRKAGLDV